MYTLAAETLVTIIIIFISILNECSIILGNFSMKNGNSFMMVVICM